MTSIFANSITEGTVPVCIAPPEQEICYDCCNWFKPEETLCCQGETEIYPLKDFNYGVDVDIDEEPVYISQDLKTRCDECYDKYLEEEQIEHWKEEQPELYEKMLDQHEAYKAKMEES